VIELPEDRGRGVRGPRSGFQNAFSNEDQTRSALAATLLSEFILDRLRRLRVQPVEAWLSVLRLLAGHRDHAGLPVNPLRRHPLDRALPEQVEEHHRVAPRSADVAAVAHVGEERVTV